ncbi:MAG: hypothetical protein COA78_04830 [Blastopirellula sp.]|nr:MAG: hypothetical protein COA78_04830 [Blastopirellula sp.]
MIKVTKISLSFLITLFLSSPPQLQGQVQPKKRTTVESPLQFIVPSKLPPIKFGEPLYVPIAIHNPTDKPVDAPSFRTLNPSFSYTVSSGNVSDQCLMYAQGFGGGSRQKLPGKATETLILLVNI